MILSRIDCSIDPLGHNPSQPYLMCRNDKAQGLRSKLLDPGFGIDPVPSPSGGGQDTGVDRCRPFVEEDIVVVAILDLVPQP